MFDVFCWQLYKINPHNLVSIIENWHQIEDMENELDQASND